MESTDFFSSRWWDNTLQLALAQESIKPNITPVVNQSYTNIYVRMGKIHEYEQFSSPHDTPAVQGSIKFSMKNKFREIDFW